MNASVPDRRLNETRGEKEEKKKTEKRKKDSGLFVAIVNIGYAGCSVRQTLQYLAPSTRNGHLLLTVTCFRIPDNERYYYVRLPTSRERSSLNCQRNLWSSDL